MHLAAPRIEIDLEKIAYNAEMLKKLYGSKGIGVMAVTKAVCGDPVVARILTKQNISVLADSKLTNIKKMRDAGVKAQFVLLKIPAISEVFSVIKYADISINTELVVIKKLSKAANDQNIRHKIILMIEMGDLREGIMPEHLDGFIQDVRRVGRDRVVDPRTDPAGVADTRVGRPGREPGRVRPVRDGQDPLPRSARPSLRRCRPQGVVVLPRGPRRPCPPSRRR